MLFSATLAKGHGKSRRDMTRTTMKPATSLEVAGILVS